MNYFFHSILMMRSSHFNPLTSFPQSSSSTVYTKTYGCFFKSVLNLASQFSNTFLVTISAAKSAYLDKLISSSISYLLEKSLISFLTMSSYSASLSSSKLLSMNVSAFAISATCLTLASEASSFPNKMFSLIVALKSTGSYMT